MLSDTPEGLRNISTKNLNRDVFLSRYRLIAYKSSTHAAMKASLAFGLNTANQNKNIRITRLSP